VRRAMTRAAAAVLSLMLPAAAWAAPGPRTVVQAFFQAGARGEVAAMTRMCTLRAANHGQTGHGVFWWAFAAVGRSILKVDPARVEKGGRLATVVVTYHRLRMIDQARRLMNAYVARMGNKLKQAHAKRITERFLKLIKTQPPKIRVILVKRDGRWMINKFKTP
jgi:hypothetical protein